MPPGPYDAVALTSANAARMVARSELMAVPAHAIGQRTADAARDSGFAQVIVGVDGAAPPDGAAFGRLLGERLAGRRVLYPCAIDRRPGLEAELSRTATVLAWPLYATVAVPNAPDRIATALRGAVPAAALVHSPSAARALAGCNVGEATMLCLSRAVADALPAGVGGARRVAERPDEASLLALLSKRP